jgi:threonine-phosphate decarboxylase
MLCKDLHNVTVLSSLSKIFGIPGLRIGFATLPPKAARRLDACRTPWNVNTLAQEAAAYLFENRAATEGFIAETVARLQGLRRDFVQMLDAKSGLRPFEGPVPFVMLQLPPALTADRVWETLAKQRILVRNCQNFEGLIEENIRISLRTKQINFDLCRRLNALAKATASVDGKRLDAS